MYPTDISGLSNLKKSGDIELYICFPSCIRLNKYHTFILKVKQFLLDYDVNFTGPKETRYLEGLIFFSLKFIRPPQNNSNYN